jgi:hypothetical protein
MTIGYGISQNVCYSCETKYKTLESETTTKQNKPKEKTTTTTTTKYWT